MASIRQGDDPAIGPITLRCHAQVSGVRVNLIKSFPLIVLPGEAVKHRRHIMSYTKRSNTDFLKAKAKGQMAEKEFMELIALMGGTASALGTVPTLSDPTPRFSRPHPTDENGYGYSVSPDILFTLPNQPKGFASLAQVKVKKLQKEPSKQWLFFYLDEKELHRMNVAAQFYDVFFVIHIPELEGIEGFSSWMWLNVDELHKDTTTLIKRTVWETPTFLLPLNLFQPISKITKRTLDEPSNTNAPPKASTV